MNYYYLSFIVILCFEPSAATREAFLRLRKTSPEAIEETKKKLSGETGLPVINGLVQVASRTKVWIDWFRRLLKALRKWCNAHPPEVKLGKCFASYFSIKIPGLNQNEKNVRQNEISKAEKLSAETTKRFQLNREAVEQGTNQKSIFQKTSIEIHFIFLARHVFSILVHSFRQFREFIFSNDLMVCLWDYSWKKFWSWVDSAPDFQLQV